MDNAIKAEHDDLKREIERERADYLYWKNTIEDPRFQKHLQGCEDEITAKKEILTDPSNKSDEDKNLKAEIVARRDILARYRTLASDSRLVDAQRRLAKFEKENAIFVSAEKASA